MDGHSVFFIFGGMIAAVVILVVIMVEILNQSEQQISCALDSQVEFLPKESEMSYFHSRESRNLAEKYNPKSALETRCKKRASEWIHKVYSRHPANRSWTSVKVRALLAELTEDEKSLTRHWLNHYNSQRKLARHHSFNKSRI